MMETSDLALIFEMENASKVLEIKVVKNSNLQENWIIYSLGRLFQINTEEEVVKKTIKINNEISIDS